MYYLQDYNNVIFAYWRLNLPIEQTAEIYSLTSDPYETIIKLHLIPPMEQLCQITTSNYTACLKTIRLLE